MARGWYVENVLVEHTTNQPQNRKQPEVRSAKPREVESLLDSFRKPTKRDTRFIANCLEITCCDVLHLETDHVLMTASAKSGSKEPYSASQGPCLQVADATYPVNY